MREELSDAYYSSFLGFDCLENLFRADVSFYGRALRRLEEGRTYNLQLLFGKTDAIGSVGGTDGEFGHFPNPYELVDGLNPAVGEGD